MYESSSDLQTDSEVDRANEEKKKVEFNNMIDTGDEEKEAAFSKGDGPSAPQEIDNYESDADENYKSNSSEEQTITSRRTSQTSGFKSLVTRAQLRLQQKLSETIEIKT